MKRIPNASLVVLLVWSAGVRAEEPEPKATVARAIKARGLKDDGKAIAMSWKDQGVVEAAGMKIEYTADFYFRAPDALRFDMVADVMGMKIKISGVIAGDKVWDVADGKVEESTGEKKEHSQAMAYSMWVATLAPLNHDKAFKLSNVVGKKVNDKPTLGVMVERKDKPAITIYFDKESGLMVKTEMNVKDEFQGWKEVLEETFYEEWMDVDGVKEFSKLKVVRDGKTFIESKPTNVKVVDKLDAKLFEKP